MTPARALMGSRSIPRRAVKRWTGANYSALEIQRVENRAASKFFSGKPKSLGANRKPILAVIGGLLLQSLLISFSPPRARWAEAKIRMQRQLSLEAVVSKASLEYFSRHARGTAGPIAGYLGRIIQLHRNKQRLSVWVYVPEYPTTRLFIGGQNQECR